MTYKVVFLQSAESDLKDLKAYLTKKFDKDVWQASYAKIKATIKILQHFPEGGKLSDELESLNLSQYREVASGMNRIIYQVRQDFIYIHIVCDIRRDMKSLLIKRLLRSN